MPRKTKLKTTTHIGRYVAFFIETQGIGIKTMSHNSKIRNHTLRCIISGTNKALSLQTYFLLAEYMQKKTGLPLEHHLRRIKEELQKGKIKDETNIKE